MRTLESAPIASPPAACSKRDIIRTFSCWTTDFSTPGWRDLDLVVIDALNPFAGGAVFPLGNLREPLSALARAGAFVIMRAARDASTLALIQQLRSFNASAPIFRARLEPPLLGELSHAPAARSRRRARGGVLRPGESGQLLGNALRALHLPPVFHWAFDDHHHYSCTQVERLAAQAQMHGSHVLLTTEKDAVNLPESTAAVLEAAGVRLYWLKIAVHIEKEDQFLELIRSKLIKAKPPGESARPFVVRKTRRQGS